MKISTEFVGINSIVERFFECFEGYELTCNKTPNECITLGCTYGCDIEYGGGKYFVPIIIECDEYGLGGYFIINGQYYCVNTLDLMERSLIEESNSVQNEVFFGNEDLLKTNQLLSKEISHEDLTPCEGQFQTSQGEFIIRYTDFVIVVVINNGIIETYYQTDKTPYKIPDITFINKWRLTTNNINIKQEFISKDQDYSWEIIPIAMAIDSYFGKNRIYSRRKYYSAGPLIIDCIKRKKSIIDSFRTSKWNVRNLGIKDNVSTMLDNITYLGDLSTILRVIPPIDRVTASVKQRMLKPWDYGRFCCIQTTDGDVVGTTKHLAKNSRIVTLKESLFIKNQLSIILNKDEIEDFKDSNIAIFIDYSFKKFCNDKTKNELLKLNGKSGCEIRLEMCVGSEIIWIDTSEDRIVTSLTVLSSHDLKTKVANELKTNDFKYKSHMETDIPTKDFKLLDIIGHTGSYLCYPESNAVVRSIFATKHIEQAISMDERSKNRFVNHSWYLIHGEQPHIGKHFRYPCGRNLIVTVAPWGGYNIEDAVVISKTCSKMFRHYKYHVLRIDMIGSKLIKIEEKLLPDLHSQVKKGQILATVIRNEIYDTVFKYTSPVDGIINKISIADTCIIIKISSIHNLEIGDKVSNRHGQKGVVSLIVDDIYMPIVKLENGLYEKCQMVISPMAVPSRETFGHLHEICGTKPSDSFEEIPTKNVIIPQNPYTCSGNTNLVAGTCFYMALKHKSHEKVQFRNTGSLDVQTLQPHGGKSTGSGLRVGYMEKDAMLASGAHNTLKSLFSIDMSNVRACKCGTTILTCACDCKSFTISMHRSTQIFIMWLRCIGYDIKMRNFGTKDFEYSIVEFDHTKIKNIKIIKVVSDLNFGINDLDSIGVSNNRKVYFAPHVIRTHEIEKLYTKLLNSKENSENILKTIDSSIKRHIAGADGILRRLSESKRVEHSLRAVIVPDPSLPLNTVKIPKGANIGSKYGLLNRQPTLSSDSLQLVELIPGNTSCIHINPLLCKTFNADFDGDEMNIYGLITEKSINESINCLPPKGVKIQDYVLADVMKSDIKSLASKGVTSTKEYMTKFAEIKARGSLNNIRNMFEEIGDIYVGGVKIGYIKSCYKNGLDIDEYWMMAQASREGIVAQGCSTAISGDIYRKSCRMIS